LPQGLEVQAMSFDDALCGHLQEFQTDHDTLDASIGEVEDDI